jgi:hypothetical protein
MKQSNIVYHGSTSLIDSIDVTKGKPFKDFGRGFYVTESKSHASNLAIRNKRIEMERFGRLCEAYLYTYEIDMTELSGFKIKRFPNADFEWLQFILSNRKARDREHDYDVVIGPTANDDTMVVINAYLDALYGEIGADDALMTLLKNIKADKLPGQIYFATNEAASTLILKGQVERL